MDIYIDTINGKKIAVYEWRPEGDIKSIVYYFHGTQSYSLWFNDIANLMIKDGIHVISIDRTGCGHSSGTREDIPDKDEAIMDYVALIKRTCQPGIPINFIGQSFGGGICLAVYFSKLLEIEINRIVIVTSYLGKLHTFDNDLRNYDKDNTKIKLNFKTKDFTNNEKYANFIDNDPLKWSSITLNSIYQSYLIESSYLDVNIDHHKLNKALYIHPELDPLVDLNHAKKIFNKIFKNKGETKSVALEQHFIWFSNEINDITKYIIEWLRDDK
ncbi:hypothetical protein AWY96_01360 [Serratia plymuthica]|uniref:alpha/beta hydrolase n=1 Tax=Serratia plymuthica TaxID=82996 RepID=UPI0007A02BB5|nr:alpha/beta fold hydrolase [Serratia plymuthica]KYQ97218.1 hypothetical protein AWY96_01360 [Serratia plymuthica]